ncbi:MAG: nitroreductase/quinone reductase family protein [Solirubrobacteraceae bacterium]
MTESTNTRATQPTEGEQIDPLSYYDTDGILTVQRKNNPFMRSPTGGRVLSAIMLPHFTIRPPMGFGVLTTTGRRTAKKRRRCVRVARRGNRAYLVMIRPQITYKASAWILNIRAEPNVSLRMRGGTFAGLARELDNDRELQQARELYCGEVNPFDYVECTFHRGWRPTRSKIEELHRNWFDTGIPLVIELEEQ